MDRAALAAVRTIVSHDECADGMASAILLHDALPAADVVFVEYGSSAERLVATPGMLFCDFSPPAARVDEFVRAGAIVLDHHRTARDVVLRFGSSGAYGDEAEDPGVSGAVLAYRHVWFPLRGYAPERPFAEAFAAAAGARDTWQTASPAWHAGCVQHAALMAFSQTFWLQMPFSRLATSWADRFAPLGEELVARQHERLVRALATAHRFTTPRGLRCVAVNGLSYASDAAEYLHDGVDAVIAFDLVDQDGHLLLRVSVRSHTSFDCAAFGQQFGGGGHTRAAGFAVTLRDSDPQSFRMLEQLFADAPMS